MKYEIALTSGVTVIVTPAPPLLRNKIMREAQQKFVLDTTPYKKQRTNIEGTKDVLDTNSPEYQQAYLINLSRQEEYVINRLLEALVAPAEATKADLINQFADERDVMRDIANDTESSDWLATLNYCLILTEDDNNAIIRALKHKLPVEGDVIDNALATFRYEVQRTGMGQSSKTKDGTGAQ